MQPKDNPPPPGGKAVRALSWDREKIMAGGKRGCRTLTDPWGLPSGKGTLTPLHGPHRFKPMPG
jgi:hypothetical protein